MSKATATGFIGRGGGDDLNPVVEMETLEHGQIVGWQNVTRAIDDLVGVRAQISILDYRVIGDDDDWGLALERARLDIMPVGGGIIYMPAGEYTFSTPVIFPKNGQSIILQGEGNATILTNDASLTTAPLVIGDATGPGGAGFTLRDVYMKGADIATSKALRFLNANTVLIKNVTFSNLLTAIDAEASYSVSLHYCDFLAVTTVFHSNTSAHNFVAERCRTFGVGKVFRFDVPTDNIVIDKCDFETGGGVLQTAGGTSLRFTGNYVEYQDADIIYHTGIMYNPEITGNLFALSALWNVTNTNGGIFKRNSLYNQSIDFSTSVDLEVNDNHLAGSSSIGTTPWTIPTLQNNWVQQNNYTRVGYRKGDDGMVHLRGNLINVLSPTLGDTTASGPFTLPAAYRPSDATTFLVGGTKGLAHVFIRIDGTVRVIDCGGLGSGVDPYELGLNGISFQPSS